MELKERMKQSRAPVKAYDAIEIIASKATVWNVLSDLTKWNLWKGVKPKVVTGAKWDVGTQFRWKRGILTIAAKIVDIDPPNKVLWTGRTLGLQAKHNWVLNETEGGTLVEDYEEWFGIGPRLFKERAQRRIETSLRSELEGLNRVAAELKVD